MRLNEAKILMSFMRMQNTFDFLSKAESTPELQQSMDFIDPETQFLTYLFSLFETSFWQTLEDLDLVLQCGTNLPYSTCYK